MQVNLDLWQTVDRFFRNNDIAGAASYLESLLRESSSDRFVSLARKHFTNTPRSVLEHINAFINNCGEEFDVRVIYLEMNGFDINYGRWYFDSFAYAEYVDDPDVLDWLCNWSSPKPSQLTLTGLEDVQEDFRWYTEATVHEKGAYETANEVAVLLVMVRFVQSIEAAIQSGDLAKLVPILATAHDFDIVARWIY
jgi:hypothetical protein